MTDEEEDMNTRQPSTTPAHGIFSAEFSVRGDKNDVQPIYEMFRSKLASEGQNRKNNGIISALAYFEPDFYAPGRSSIEVAIEATGTSMSDVEDKARDLITKVAHNLGITLVGDAETGSDDSNNYEEYASFLISA